MYAAPSLPTSAARAPNGTQHSTRSGKNVGRWLGRWLVAGALAGSVLVSLLTSGLLSYGTTPPQSANTIPQEPQLTDSPGLRIAELQREREQLLGELRSFGAQPGTNTFSPSGDDSGGYSSNSYYSGSSRRTRRRYDGAPKSVRVSGYRRKDGTYVHSYSRRRARR